ncbi:hypothetical protein BO94DRAFT_614478 [Aspergillus sclerotioniger CBS 115572]|uniref:Protein kinase domain-containing protein n=1 Tax=Aspergillus sclerotioniger CBS 115572 TaxID=1450535 RepID=A0A317X6Z9_9EURO|nr:hypothetical protein BO94DRAFT_614478 [Aspergillus sclerotioniger CBS 115572]PWY93412.1 hypothetical protein BO94DRAFT_614478 [Aspergillus sclerotioniger CBS 115572]
METYEGYPIMPGIKSEILSSHKIKVKGAILYRVQVEDKIKYVCVNAHTLRGRNIVIIPSFEGNEDANLVEIWRGQNGKFKYDFDIFPGVSPQHIWHRNQFDLSRLQKIDEITENVSIVKLADHTRTFIAKVKVVEPEEIDLETRIYGLLRKTRITPRFMGHICEGEDVRGFLLEKVDAIAPLAIDFDACKRVLQTLHDYNWCLGKVTKDNFLIQTDGTAKLIGFGHCKTCSFPAGRRQWKLERKMLQELETLRRLFKQ